MKKKLGDMLFIFIVILFIVFYYVYDLKGLDILAWIFFLPLYVLRIIVWSFWPRLHPLLSTNLTPKTWPILVFSIWGSLSLLIWLLVPNILLRDEEISLPRWLQIIGFIFAIGGLGFSLWAHLLIGLKTAILTTRIFDQENKEEQKVIKAGPYALFPHPIFLGECLIILGCYLLTSEVSLLGLLLIAFLVDIFAARGEEKDLRERFGEEYQNYRSHFLLFDRGKRKP